MKYKSSLIGLSLFLLVLIFSKGCIVPPDGQIEQKSPLARPVTHLGGESPLPAPTKLEIQDGVSTPYVTPTLLPSPELPTTTFPPPYSVTSTVIFTPTLTPTIGPTPLSLLSLPWTGITETQILTGHNSIDLAWSPDGLKLSYVNLTNIRGGDNIDQLWVFEVITGRHTHLLDNVSAASWSPDGRTLAVSMPTTDTQVYDVALYDIETQHLTPLQVASEAETIWLTTDNLLYRDNRALKVVNVETNQIRFEIEIYSPNVKHLLNITTGPNTIISYNSEKRLMRFDLQVDQRQPLVVEKFIMDQQLNAIALSPLNEKLAYISEITTQSGFFAEFRILDFITGEEQTLLQSGDYGFKKPWMRYPTWSPDGQFITIIIAQVNGTNPPFDLYLFNVTTGQMYEMPLIRNLNGPLLWSSDGKRLAFFREHFSKALWHTKDLYVIELE